MGVTVLVLLLPVCLKVTAASLNPMVHAFVHAILVSLTAGELVSRPCAPLFFASVFVVVHVFRIRWKVLCLASHAVCVPTS